MTTLKFWSLRTALCLASWICSIALFPTATFASDARCKIDYGLLSGALAGLANSGDKMLAEAPVITGSPVRNISGNIELVSLSKNVEFWKVGWRGVSPPFSIRSQWVDAKITTIIPCGSDITLTNKEMEFRQSTLAAEDGSSFRVSNHPNIFRVSRPIFDKDRQHALSAVQVSSGGLAGMTRLVYLARSRRGWSVIGDRIVSVS